MIAITLFHFQPMTRKGDDLLLRNFRSEFFRDRVYNPVEELVLHILHVIRMGHHDARIANMECVETGKPPMTFEDFEKAVAAQSEDDFARSIKSPNMQSRMAALGVASVTQFKERAREYYDRFVRNELREKVYPLYIRFDRERAQNPGLRFENFLAAEIETALS